jgi:hypothetical protein
MFQLSAVSNADIRKNIRLRRIKLKFQSVNDRILITIINEHNSDDNPIVFIKVFISSIVSINIIRDLHIKTAVVMISALTCNDNK